MLTPVEWLMTPDAPELPTLADLLPPRPAWMAEGLCRNRPDVTWFPERGQSAAPAKAICAECPQRVRTACLEYAQNTGAEGIWGGTAGRERRALVPGESGRRGHIMVTDC